MRRRISAYCIGVFLAMMLIPIEMPCQHCNGSVAKGQVFPALSFFLLDLPPVMHTECGKAWVRDGRRNHAEPRIAWGKDWCSQDAKTLEYLENH